MHVDYEYICAGIIFLLILSVTEISLFNIMTHQIAGIEQDEGIVAAEKILGMILLSPGEPPNWGDYETDPLSLGLAVHNSLEAYVLDPSKVIRLCEDSDYYISPGKARHLLGLSKNFQFSLQISPVFIIDIDSHGDGTYALTLTDNKGFPVSNVNVTGYYVPMSLTPGVEYPSKSEITRIDGSCTLEFEFVQDNVLVVYANQLEVKVVKTEPPDLDFKVEGGCIVESDVPLIQFINYSTGSVFGLKKESVFRYVEIEGLTYYVEFNLWS